MSQFLDISESTKAFCVPYSDPFHFIGRDPPVFPVHIKQVVNRARHYRSPDDDKIIIAAFDDGTGLYVPNWVPILNMRNRTNTVKVALQDPTIAKIYHLARMSNSQNSFTLTVGSKSLRKIGDPNTWLYIYGGFLDRKCETLDDFLNLVPKELDNPIKWNEDLWITENTPTGPRIHDLLLFEALVPLEVNHMDVESFLFKVLDNKNFALPTYNIKDAVVKLNGILPETLETEYNIRYEPAHPSVQKDLLELFQYVYADKIPTEMSAVIQESITKVGDMI